MALRNIVKVGDPILRKTSRPVVNFDKKLWTLLDDMRETLSAAQGAGLAAVQVGILRRVVVVDIQDDGKGVMELINPEIMQKSDETEITEEGCLSVPGKWGTVERPKTVVVKAQDRNGKWCIYKGEGLRARCFCHEIDHLDGHLFTDYMIKEISQEEIYRNQNSIRRTGKTQEGNK